MLNRTVFVSAFAAALPLVSACNRNAVDAVNMANEADKERGSNVDDAISKYEQATQLDPTNYRILWKLATAYQKKEQWDKVALTCSKAEKIAPTHADYYALHGYALVQQAEKTNTNWSDAKDPLEQATKLDPNLADPHYDLGNVYLHLDQEKDALDHWTKAVSLSPDKLPYYVPLADLYIRLGFLNEAEQVIKESLNYEKTGADAGGSFNVHTLYGEIYERKGDWNGAVKEFETAKKACGACNDKGQQIAFFNLGAAYTRVTPPNKSGASGNLKNFQKIICRGGAAARYADECTQAQELLKGVEGAAAP